MSSAHEATESPATPRGTLTVFRIAAACTIAAVALGSVVCATESGFECGTWPGCQSGALLPVGPVSTALYQNPWIEMVHRTSAILAGPFAVAAGVLAGRLHRAGRTPLLTAVLPWVTVAGALVAGYVGRGVVLGVEFPTWVAAADLGSAVLAMAAIVTATVLLERPGRRRRTPSATWAWTAFGSALAMHLTSLFVAGAGSFTRCVSWPVAEILPADAGSPLGLHIVRFILCGLAALATIFALRAARPDPALRPTAVATTAAFGAVVGLFVIRRVVGHADLGVVYSLASVAVLVTLVLLGARALAPEPAATPATPDLEATAA
ncbi:MAG: hypothetical protein L0G22_02310 [Propionibacteriaceae bacterium]|nr:hypothetical protein [Propionibacteriaceae bacterium]